MNKEKCEFYIKNDTFNCKIYKSPATCGDVPSCYYKQLHSQEKTFTVEYITETIDFVMDKYFFIDKNSSTQFKNLLIAEFEKKSERIKDND